MATYYCTDEDGFYSLSNVGEVVDELRGEYEDSEIVGMQYYSGEFKQVEPSEYLNVDNILENADEYLYDNVGHPDGGVDCFTDVSEDAKKELEQLLKTWCDKHVKCNLWESVGNVTMHIIKQEDLA